MEWFFLEPFINVFDLCGSLSCRKICCHRLWVYLSFYLVSSSIISLNQQFENWVMRSQNPGRPLTDPKKRPRSLTELNMKRVQSYCRLKLQHRQERPWRRSVQSRLPLLWLHCCRVSAVLCRSAQFVFKVKIRRVTFNRNSSIQLNWLVS